MIYDFDFHPPDDARLFRMPAEGIRRFDAEAFVAEISYGDVIVRHYAVRDHWFKVNCTLDSDANFIETTSPEDDVPPFAFKHRDADAAPRQRAVRGRLVARRPCPL